MIFLDEEEWSMAHRGGWYFYNYLFEDEAFIKSYVAKWKELSPTIFDQLFSYLESNAASAEAPAFDASVELDNQLWNQDRRTASERTQGIISWLTRRKAWMDRAVEAMSESVSGIQTLTVGRQHEDRHPLQSSRPKGSQPLKGHLYLQRKEVCREIERFL